MSAGTAPGEASNSLTDDLDAGLEQPPHLSINPVLFHKFQKLIYSETGIWLSDAKTALLCGRLFRRLRELKIGSLKAYYDCVCQPDQHEERARMIDAITTNETRFFREPRQFEFLVQKVFPRWQTEADKGIRSKRLRIWSAGCSSGEEPYTLAMLLTAHLPAENGWEAQILGTDISNRALEKGRKAIYPLTRATEIPEDLLHSFMLRGNGERRGEMKVKIEIQQMIEFRRFNLIGESLNEAPFDIIFCRNVLIYFDAASKQAVVTNLLRYLVPNGLLFVGHAENLSSISNELRSIEPTIYLKTGNQESC